MGSDPSLVCATDIVQAYFLETSQEPRGRSGETRKTSRIESESAKPIFSVAPASPYSSCHPSTTRATGERTMTRRRWRRRLSRDPHAAVDGGARAHDGFRRRRMVRGPRAFGRCQRRLRRTRKRGRAFRSERWLIFEKRPLKTSWPPANNGISGFYNSPPPFNHNTYTRTSPRACVYTG